MATRGAMDLMDSGARKRIAAAQDALSARFGVDVPVRAFERMPAEMLQIRELETTAGFLEALAAKAGESDDITGAQLGAMTADRDALRRNLDWVTGERDALRKELDQVNALMVGSQNTPTDETPDLTAMTRADLDAYAATLGVEGAEKLPNKGAVIEAIEEALTAPEGDDGDESIDEATDADADGES